MKDGNDFNLIKKKDAASGVSELTSMQNELSVGGSKMFANSGHGPLRGFVSPPAKTIKLNVAPRYKA